MIECLEKRENLMKAIPDKNSMKHYLFLWSGQLSSMVGSSIVQFSITWWITITTQSPIFLSLGIFLYMLPMSLIFPFSGVLSDRWNKKKIMLIADSIQGILTLAIIGLFFVNFTSPILVILINSLRGVFQAFHMPTANAIIPTMVPKESLSRINGINHLFTSLIELIGPVIAATLLAFVPIELVLWFDPITCLVALGPLIIVNIPSVKSIEKEEKEIVKPSFITELRDGMKTLKSLPGVLTLLLVAMMINFLFRPFPVLIPYFILTTQNGTATDLALVMALLQGGLIFGAISTTVKKNWKHKVAFSFIGDVVIMSGVIVIALIQPGYFILIGLTACFIGFVMPIMNTIFTTILQTSVPPDKLGRITSIDYGLSLAIVPVGTIISGILGEFIGVRLLFIIAGSIGLVLSLTVWLFSGIRKVRFENNNK